MKPPRHYHDLREPEWRALLRALIETNVGVAVKDAERMFLWYGARRWPGFQNASYTGRPFLVNPERFLYRLARVRNGHRWASFVANAREALERTHAERALEWMGAGRMSVGVDMARSRIQGQTVTLFAVDDIPPLGDEAP